MLWSGNSLHSRTGAPGRLRRFRGRYLERAAPPSRMRDAQVFRHHVPHPVPRGCSIHPPGLDQSSTAHQVVPWTVATHCTSLSLRSGREVARVWRCQGSCLRRVASPSRKKDVFAFPRHVLHQLPGHGCSIRPRGLGNTLTAHRSVRWTVATFLICASPKLRIDVEVRVQRFQGRFLERAANPSRKKDGVAFCLYVPYQATRHGRSIRLHRRR